MRDIREIAEENLDSVVQKGQQIAEKHALRKSSQRKHRSEMRKSLSFNPNMPVEMNRNEAHLRFHCPYQMTETGFMPYSADYWLDQISHGSFQSRPDYREGYNHLREYFRAEKSMREKLLEETGRITKSLVKAKVPIGTIHEWNGIKMQKVSEGKGFHDWVPVDQGKGKHPVEESAQQRTAQLQGELKQRQAGKPEPHSNPEKRAQLDKRSQELDQREQELDAREHDHKNKELDFRTKQVEEREKAAETNEGKESVSDRVKSGVAAAAKVKEKVFDAKNGKTTKQHYADDSGHGYSEEREKLHSQILDKFLKDIKPAAGKPVAILVGGGSGSGKTGVMKSAVSKMGEHGSGFVHVDADEIKKQLPEYNDMVAAKEKAAAKLAHEESSDLSSELIDRASTDNKSFVYDSTMKNPQKFKRLITELKKRGYHVHVAFADIDKEIALERAKSRAERTGREIPEDVFHAAHDGSKKTLGEIHKMADSVHVYSTNKNPPESVFTQPPPKVHDQAMFDDMKKRGHTIEAEVAKAEKKTEEMPEDVKKFTEAIEKFRGDYHDGDGDPSVIDEGVEIGQYPKRKDKQSSQGGSNEQRTKD